MSHHKHQHDHIQVKGRPLLIAISLNLLITVAQVIGGIISGSLALLGDALHNFSDVLSLIISYVANRLRGKNNTTEKTFGYKRAQILAAFINALTLIGVSMYLIFEASQRLFTPQTVLSKYVILLALAGIVVNGGSAYLLISMQKGDSNLRAAYLHLLGDLATSVAVLLGGLAMWFFNVFWIDSAITIAVSIYLIYTAGKLFLHSINVLMQFVPSDIDIPTVCTRLKQVNGIAGLHHVHVWRLDDDSIHFEGHVRLENDITISAFESIRQEIERVLHQEYGINHCIVQPEIEPCAESELIVKDE